MRTLPLFIKITDSTVGIAEEVELEDGKRVYRYKDDFFGIDFDMELPKNKNAKWKFFDSGAHTKMISVEGFTYDVFTSPILAFEDSRTRILDDTIGYSSFFEFISKHLPRYHARNDVLETDLLWRYLDNEELDEEDYQRMKQENPHKYMAVDRLIELETGFCEESLRVFYAKYFADKLKDKNNEQTTH